MLVDSAALFVDKESFVGHHHARLSIYVVEIAHQVMRVEVKLLDAEGSWHFSTLVHLVFLEHHLLL